MQIAEPLIAPPPGAAPASRWIVAHRSWREAHDRVLAAVRAGRGLVLLSGSAGTGKTLLLQELARTLRVAGFDALLQLRGDIPIDPEQAEAGCAGGAGLRVILVDEAHRLDEAALRQLGRLGAGSLVLAGLAGPAGWGGALPPGAVPVGLVPLGRDEVGAFVAARLAQAGQHADRISGQAVARLAERSGGVPRVLDMLVSAALFLSEGGRIEAAHVDEAYALRGGSVELDAPVPPRQQDASAPPPVESAAAGAPARYRAAALGAVAGVAAVCGWLALRPGDSARQVPPVLAERSPVPNGLSESGPAGLAGAERPGPAVPEPAGAALEAAVQAVELLPAGAPARVVLLYARGDAGAASRAAGLALALRKAGLSVDDPVAVTGRGKPGVHYFFAEDRMTAGAVLQLAKLPGASLPASAAGWSPPPRPGTIEVVVSSN